jgi:hypothetical protein
MNTSAANLCWTYSADPTRRLSRPRRPAAARGIEYDPRYCDVAIRRWQAYTGKHARLAATEQTFEDVEDARGS